MAMAALTLEDYGMGWDEITRWNSGDLKVDYYQTLLSGDTDHDIAIQLQRDRYPGLFDIPLSVMHELIGFDRFYWGHVWAVFFGVCGMVGIWFIGRSLESARLGFWAVLFLILTPSFYGHLYQNPKDIPFAAMYTIGLLSLVGVAKVFPAITIRGSVLIGLGIGLAMSVRLGGMVLFGYYLVLCGAWAVKSWLLSDISKRGNVSSWLTSHRHVFWLLLRGGVVATLVACVILMLWWPASHQGGLFKASQTLHTLHSSASPYPLIFRGEGIFASEAPWFYAVWMFVIKSPENLLLLFAVGLGGVVVTCLRGVRSALLALPLPWVVVICGAFFPLLYLSWSAPALHNAERHFLFVYPACCLVAAQVYLIASDKFIERSSITFLWLFRGVVCFLLGLQIVHIIALHPYQYVYYNSLVGGAGGSFGRYDNEYWFTSTQHGLELLENKLDEEGALGERAVRVYVAGPRHVADYFLSDRFILANTPKEAEFVIVNTQMMAHLLFDGEVLGKIEREGLPILYIYDMGRPHAAITE